MKTLNTRSVGDRPGRLNKDNNTLKLSQLLGYGLFMVLMVTTTLLFPSPIPVISDDSLSIFLTSKHHSFTNSLSHPAEHFVIKPNSNYVSSPWTIYVALLPPPALQDCLLAHLANPARTCPPNYFASLSIIESGFNSDGFLDEGDSDDRGFRIFQPQRVCCHFSNFQFSLL